MKSSPKTASSTTIDSSLVRFLAKLAKKRKGGVDLNLARQAFTLLAGWSIEELCVPLEMWRSHDAQRVLSRRISDCYVHRDHDPRTYKDLKTLTIGVHGSIDSTRSQLQTFCTVVTTVPTEVTLGTIYVSQLGASVPATSTGWPTISIGLAWLGVAAWKVTARSGASKIVHAPVNYDPSKADPIFETLASFWTFVYKHRIDVAARATLDSLGSHVLATATKTKAEREHIEAARQHIPAIATIFRNITKRRFQEVVDYLTDLNIFEAVEYIKRRNAKDPSYRGFHAYAVLYSHDSQTNTYNLVPDYKEKAAELAHRDATQAREAFVFKNTTRVSLIAKEKGQIPKAKVQEALDGQGVGGFGSKITFRFTDGAVFELRNKTVWKRSSNGIRFAQFPTTFHNVRLPDGSQMSRPSEKRMQEVFAKA